MYNNQIVHSTAAFSVMHTFTKRHTKITKPKQSEANEWTNATPNIYLEQKSVGWRAYQANIESHILQQNRVPKW